MPLSLNRYVITLYIHVDGEIYQTHPLFSTDPVALQLILYYDELELCNPLGSRRKKHKIGIQYVHVCIIMYTMHMLLAGAFYYILGNVDPRFRSKIHSIQLLILAKYSSVAEFGIDQILEPAVKDIEKLESVGMIMYK